MKIRTKLVVLLIPLIILPLLALGLFAFEQLKNTSKEKTLAQISTLLDQVDLYVQSDFDTINANLKLFSNSDLLKRYLFADEEDRYSLWQRPLLTLFSSYIQSYPDYYEMRVLLPDGFEDTRITLDNTENRYEQEDHLDYFKKIQQSDKMMDTLLFRNPDNQEIAFLAYKKMILHDPSFELNSSLRGYLVITIRPSYILQQLKNNNLGDKGLILFTDENGNILFQNKGLNKSKSIPTEMLNKLITSFEKKQFIKSNYRGQLFYFKGKQLHHNLYIISGLSEKEMFSASRPLKKIVTIVILFTILLTGGLLYLLLSRIIIKPVLELKKTTEQITKIYDSNKSRLEYKAKDNIRTLTKIEQHNDEIGDLGKSFNTMSRNLEQMYQKLEQQHHRLEELITERTNELVLAKNHAEDANKAKSLFLAKMSHEIRTPLHGVVGLTQLLSRQNLDHVQAEIVDKLTMSSNLLHQLIDDVLDLAKIESNKLHLEQVPFDIRKTIDECLTPLQVQFIEKNIQLAKIIDPYLPQYLLGDPYRISQIILNLAGNALKFTNKGKVSVELKVLERRDKHILLGLSVADTGMGISAEQQQRIFTSFTQADNAVTRQYGGTGLGLSICQQLVSLMSGTISVQSTIGKGSVFNCNILLSNHNPIQEKKDLPKSDEMNHNIHILVVDDELINRFLAQGLLEDVGFKVTLAESGQIALKIATKEKIDLVLMDLHMPDLNGWDTTKLFRSSLLAQVSTIPIIGLTADILKESHSKCLNVGMNLVVSKPFQIAELKENILTILKK